jgi:hypothetical protein
VIQAPDRSKPRDAVAEMMRDALAGTPVVGFTPPSPQIAGGPVTSTRRPRP